MSRKSFISAILKQDDNSQVHLLPHYNKSEVLRNVCAFLNTDGGWIVVGIDGTKVVGVGDNPELLANSIDTAIASLISPQPLVYTKTELYQDQAVVLINVMKGPNGPYSYNGKYFVRSRGRSKEGNVDEIGLLLRDSKQTASTWEKSTVLGATVDDLSFAEIDRTMSIANKTNKAEQLPNDIAEFLGYFQLFEYNNIKNGAIILFGKNPARFFTQARIRITVMPEGKIADSYSDHKLFTFNLFDSFEKLQEYFKYSIPIMSQFSRNDWNREDKYKIPMDVLDEALVNAMVHRDYGDFAGEVGINILPNRIEITNSGEIPSDIISGKNTIHAHHSILRNPMVAHMFYLRGKMEKLGRGLDLIVNRCVDSGLKKPEWKSKDGYTTLTLFSIAEDIRLSDRIISFLNQIHSGQMFTRETYEQYFENKISEKTARLDLAKMVTAMLLDKIGDGPATRYVRTTKKLPGTTG